MTPERWRLVERLFEAAVPLDAAGRAALLERDCDDPALRAEVAALLEAHDRAAGFLSRPALAGVTAGLAPTVVAGGEPRESDGLVGQVLDGKYRVSGVIGKGGMGVVFRATHLHLDREVAIKVLRGAALDDELAAVRFRREAQAVARLKHPNIVTIYDFHATAGLGAYIVMELLRGRSLRQELRARGALPPAEAVGLMLQVLAAVDAAHRAGVIHRDLKPENVLVESPEAGGAVKVLDFGIAKLRDEAARGDASATQAGSVLGTPLYMAPEVWAGDEADERSDVYALGCVLYELLTGRPPFVAEGVSAIRRMHLRDEPPAPSAGGGPPSGALDAAVRRALAKEPARRFASAEDFARALSGGADTGERATLALRPGAETRGVTSPHAAGSAPNNLPHLATRFVGREPQVEEVLRLLAATRVLTLTGPGGIGKTRLALEAAARAGGFDDGVWFAKLAAVTDPGRVAAAVAEAAGVREEPGVPVPATLARWFGPRRALLILDNCEHLVGECARLADELVRACPELRVVATSREPLVIPGEAVWLVPPLGVPDERALADPRALAASEAVRLFLDRAEAAKPGFGRSGRAVAAAARVVRRLDGIPLAIELAAARVRVLSPEQILARLDDVFALLTGGSRTALPRQQTLRATIDWSHDMLGAAERALLRRLAVFRGGWTLEAAEGVCAGGGLDAGEVMETLAQLVERSLVAAADATAAGGVPLPRYRMLEVIRQYAAAKLDEAGEAGRLRAAHRDWFLAFAAGAEDQLIGAGQAEWLARFEADHENFRSALAASAGAEAQLELCCALARFWMFRGHWGEARSRLERGLAAGEAPGRLRARSLYWLAHFAIFQGDFAGAEAPAAEALAYWRGAGDALGTARSLHQLAEIHTLHGRLDEGVEAAEACLHLARELNDANLLASATSKLGQIAQRRGRYEESLAWYEECLPRLRELGRTEAVAGMYLNLADVARSRGDFAAARRFLGASREEQRELGSLQLRQLTNFGLAEIARLSGEDAEAEALFRASLAEARELGDRWNEANCLAGLAGVALARGDAGEARARFEEALAADPGRSFAEALGVFLDEFAAAAAREGRAAEALRLAGAARAAREAVGLAPLPVLRDRAERALAPAVEEAGGEAWRLLDEGRAMGLDRAIAIALGRRPV